VASGPSNPPPTRRPAASGPPKGLSLSAVAADEYADGSDPPPAVVSEEEEEEEDDHFDAPVPSAPDSPRPASDSDDSPPRKPPSPVLRSVHVDVPPKRRQRPQWFSKAADHSSTQFSRTPAPETARPELLHLLYRPPIGATKYRNQKPISASREPAEADSPPRKSTRRRIPTVNDDLPIFHSEDDRDFTKARRFRGRVAPDDLALTRNLSPIPKRKAGPADASATTGLDEYLAEGGARRRRTVAPKGQQADTAEFLRVEKDKAKKQSVWMFVPLDGTDQD
jgi:hypothetical protein